MPSVTRGSRTSQQASKSVSPAELLEWLRGLLAQWGRIERLAGGFKACCPAHEDRNPSLSVKPGDVRLMLHCFAGCSEEAVLQALGISSTQQLFYEQWEPRDERPSSSTSRPRPVVKPEPAKPARAYKTLAMPNLGKPVATYAYCGLDKQIVYLVGRYQTGEGKSFRQFVPAGGGAWFRRGPEASAKVLYKLPELRASVEAGHMVVLVEGEKDADNGTALGLDGVVFTSAAGGAKAPWQPQYTEQLAGARLVLIVADADEPGHQYAATVKAALDDAGVPVRVVESTKGKDLSDHLEAGGTLEDLVDAELPAPPAPPAPPSDDDAGLGADDGDGGIPTVRRRGPRYVVEDGMIWRETFERDDAGVKRRQLTLVLGCMAQITRTIRSLLLDEAQDAQTGNLVSQFVVEAVHPSTGEVREFTLPVKEWRDGSWLDSLWPDVRFRKDRQGRNDVLAAVAAQSRDAREETLHAATGWTEVQGRRAFIHAGGAITSTGVLEIATDLPQKLQSMRLEAPSTPATVEDDLAESIGLLFEDWMPHRVAFVLAGIAYRSILPANALVALMVAPPGSGKTAISMIAGEHFYPAMSQANKCFLSMAALGSTAKSAQMIQHRAKDALMVIDDFPPQTSSADRRAGADQSAMIRASYDRAARDVLSQDRRMVPGPVPRCAVLSSAEYAPADTGARERALVVPMPWGVCPPVDEIASAQSPARARARSRFMAWVIQQTAKVSAEDVEAWTSERDAHYGAALRAQGYDARTSEHVAKLLTGWAWVVSRLAAAGILPELAQQWLEGPVWAAALDAAAANHDPDADVTPADQLVRMIGDVLGRGHVASASSPDSPPSGLDPAGCGWSVAPGMSVIHRARGDRLGWVREDRLWLDPATVLSAVQRLAVDEGVQLAANSVAAASSLLATASLGMISDPGKHSHRVRVGGLRHRVWDVPVSLFWGDDTDDDQSPLSGPGQPPTPPSTPTGGPVPPTPTTALQAPPGGSGDAVTTCVVCGQVMVPIAGADRHPMCEGEPACPAPSVTRPAPVAESRWRAAEAILTADAAILPDGTRLELPAKLSHIGDIARWAGEQRIGHGGGASRPEPGHIWLSRDFLEARGLPVRDVAAIAAGELMRADEQLAEQLRAAHAEHEFFTSAPADGYQSGKTALSGWTRVWRKATADSAVVTSSEWVSMRGLADGDPTPDHLIRRLGLWTSTTGQPLVINEGVTFKTMCKLPALELPPLPWASMAADFMWQRELGDNDRAAFVHAYDRRKSYLAACSAVEASDSLMHVRDPEVDPKRPGFWHVVSATWHDLGYGVPDPRLDYEGLLCEWVPTPTLALLLEHCDVVVDEAWLYVGQTSRVIDRAYRAIRGALEQAERWDQGDPDVVALVAALKASYRVGIGQMAQTKDEGLAKRGHRPDVRATIIATHRANSLRAMIHAGKAGSWPLVMARADTVLIASDEADPMAAWPGRPDGISQLMGKYKPAGTQNWSEFERLALVDPITPSRSVWAVTDPDKAEQLLADELEDANDWEEED